MCIVMMTLGSLLGSPRAVISLNPHSQYSDIVGTVISAIEVQMQTTLVKHTYSQILESS